MTRESMNWEEKKNEYRKGYRIQKRIQKIRNNEDIISGVPKTFIF